MARLIATTRDATRARPAWWALCGCVMLTACRTQLPAPPDASPTVSRPSCADPQLVTVKLEVPVTWVASGDWNGDGAPDLVGGGLGISQVYNAGNGFFREPTDPHDRATPSFAAVGDFDGDGIDDVVMARFERQVELWKGVRNINQSRGSKVVNNFLPRATGVAAGDADGDGIADVVLLDSDAQGTGVRLLFGRDGIDFEPPTVLSFPAAQGFVALVDLDRDRHADILAPTGNEISVISLMRRARGTFSSGPTLSALTLPRPAAALAFADFDEDGVLDLAACTPERLGDNVFLGRGRGDGTFTGPLAMRAGVEPRSLVALDWNLDGHQDLAVANSGTDHSFSLFFGAGDGTFADAQPCQAVTFESTGGPSWVTSADYDRDGRADLAFAYYDGLSIIRNLPR